MGSCYCSVTSEDGADGASKNMVGAETRSPGSWVSCFTYIRRRRRWGSGGSGGRARRAVCCFFSPSGSRKWCAVYLGCGPDTPQRLSSTSVRCCCVFSPDLFGGGRYRSPSPAMGVVFGWVPCCAVGNLSTSAVGSTLLHFCVAYAAVVGS